MTFIKAPSQPEPYILAAVFDLDGVLMDTETIAFAVWRDITAQAGGQLEDSHFSEMAGLTAEETAAYIMKVCAVSFDSRAAVSSAWQLVTDAINRGIEPLAGARDLLEALRMRGLPLAVASNSPTPYIENALQGLGLRDFFSAIVGVDQVANGKPDPEIYRSAAARLGVLPQRCLAVEDSYVGSQAALGAGMRVVAVPAATDARERFAACHGIFSSLVPVAADVDALLA